MGQPLPKQFLRLAGRSLLEWSLRSLVAADVLAGLIVVAPVDHLPRTRRILDAMKRALPDLPSHTIVAGGARRQDSVACGVQAVPVTAAWILVHDAARPLVPPAVVAATLQAARRHGAAVAALPSVDTLVTAERGMICGDVNRETTFRLQTPQVFWGPLLRQALQQALRDDFTGTDDSILVRRLGHPVHLVPGSARALKVTTPDDLATLAALPTSAFPPARSADGQPARSADGQPARSADGQPARSACPAPRRRTTGRRRPDGGKDTDRC